MYRPKKEERATPSNRVRLEMLGAMPEVRQMRAQLDEATAKRGSTVELPWTAGSISHRFILQVQWMDGAEFPVWTLYEENGNDSKMHWSQGYPPSDTQLVYDVVAMSAASLGPSGSQASSKIPDSLKLRFPDPQEAKAAPTPAPKLPEPEPPPPPPPAPAPVQPGGLADLRPAGGGMTDTYPPGNVFPERAPGGYGAGPDPYHQAGGYPPGGGYPPSPYPQAPAQQPPGYGYPPPYPPQQMPPQQYQQQPQYPPNNSPWLQPPQQSPFINPAQGQGTSTGSSLPPELDFPTKIPLYNDLMAKGANILIGELLVEAGLITNPTLEAALKVQDLVREEKLTPQLAPEALKKFHALGGSIEDLIAGLGKPAPQRPPSTQAPAAAGKPPPPKPVPPKEDPERARKAAAAIDLLKNAGILSEADLKSAQDVRSKHGGDIVQILQSANKIDNKTFLASVDCIPLVRDGLFKVEQCIILLNYCSRSRVGFDEAIEELGWPNPKKT